MLRPKFLSVDCEWRVEASFWLLVLCAVLCLGSGALAQALPAAGPADASPRPDRFVVVPSTELADDLSGTPKPRNPSAAVKGELLVRFRPGLGRARQQSAVMPLKGKARFFASVAPGGNAMKMQAVNSVLDHLAVVAIEPDADLAKAAARLRRNPDVLYAEPNYRVQLAAGGTEPVMPNDFDFAQLWGMHNVGQADGTQGADIGMLKAWESGTGNQRVIVGIIDTGLDYYHPDLAGNIWFNPGEISGNGIDDDNNGYIDDVHGYDFVSADGDPMDDHGHGTHVAGTIGAVGNNRIGVSGVCWQVSIIGLKAFDDAGNGDVAATIDALRYAIQNGARIINASWGNNDKSRALEEVIAQASDAGVLFVAAAGNDNSDALFYPAAYPHVVAVGATDSKDRRAKFSNFGPFVDLAAPGENIYSTLPNNSYGFFSGTSMAAPHVTGVAALVLALHPEFRPDQLSNILRNAVDTLTPDKYIGTGRINASAAVRIGSPLPLVELLLPETIYGSIDITGSASGGAFAGYSLEYGKGANPTNWTSFFSSATPVSSGGALFRNFSTPELGEGVVTFRVTAQNAAGERAAERISVQIRNVHISFPTHNDIVRAGERIPIRGTVYGENRRYTMSVAAGLDPKEWTDAEIELTSGGTAEVKDGVLAIWDTRRLQANQFYTLKLTATAGNGETTEFVSRLVYLDARLKAGWPQYLPVSGVFPNEDWRHVTVADLDGDQQDELVVVDHGNSDNQPAHLLVYASDGLLLWSKELASGPPFTDIPVVGDLDGDGRAEIIVDAGSDRQLFAFQHNGTPAAGNWPVQLEAAELGKVLADLRGDGQMELVGYSRETVARGEKLFRQLVVYDRSGSLIQKWEVPDCDLDLDLDAPRLLPAVGNLDADPDLEIVAVTGCGGVAAFKLGRDTPLWQADTIGVFASSPVIGDLFQNGANQVLIAAYDRGHGNRGGVYAFNSKGKSLPGWPALVQESFEAAPALGDVNGDGRLEVSLPSAQSGLLHLLEPNGFEVEGWPVGPVNSSSMKSSTVLGDVDGDGEPDVVLASPGYMSTVVNSRDLSRAGGIKAWTASGEPITLSGSTNVPGLLIESSGGIWLKAAPVTLADVDHDGKLDIIATSIQDRTYLPPGEKAVRKNRSSIYVWGLDVPFTPSSAPWPSLQRNAQHTGYIPAPPKINQPPKVAGIPDQVVAPGASFLPIYLDQYVEDPDDDPATMTWTVVGQGALVVRIDTNRVATIDAPSSAWAGQESLQFVATDPGGLQGQATARLEARPGYIAPVAAPDRLVLLEDTAGEIDVLANDSDSAGASLSLLSYGKPRLGRLKAAAGGRLLYTPRPDANGLDAFSYVLSNGRGGVAIGAVTIEITPVDDPPVGENDHVVLDEDTATLIEPLANDRELDGEQLVLLDFTQPNNGALTVDGSALRYVPNTNYSGADEFIYVLSDERRNTSTAAVKVIVRPVNDLPIAESQKLAVNKNASLNITFAAQDPDDTELTYKVIDSPRHGTLWTYPAVAVYYPTNGFSGQDSITYRANDGKEDGPLATIEIEIADANNPPQLDDISVVTKVGQPAQIRLVATDLDNDPVKYEIVREPAHGSLSVIETTNYLYQPNPGFLGMDDFTVRASDGRDTSRIAKVTVTVTDQNTPPSAQDFSVRTLVNTPTNITLRATDPESNPLNYHVVSRPKSGKLTGKGSVLTYSPSPHFAGSDRFQFKVDDGELGSEAATVTISVEPPNRAPNASTNQQVFLLKNTAAAIQLAVEDPDGDAVQCPILKGPKHGRVNGSGAQFTYTPKPDFVGSDTFTYKAWDGQTYSKQGIVLITVASSIPVAPPTFTSVMVRPDGTVELSVKAPESTNVRVAASSDLVNWTLLRETLAGGETVSFLDPEAPQFPARFYRAQYVEP